MIEKQEQKKDILRKQRIEHLLSNIPDYVTWQGSYFAEFPRKISSLV